jgi:hypothetical protein
LNIQINRVILLARLNQFRAFGYYKGLDGS